MSYLNNLKYLEAPPNLQKLPCTLHLNSLEELTLRNHDIQVLPEIIGHLRKLDLRETKIKELPSSIVLLSSLISLDLSYCHLLETLPNNFGHLSSLISLDLSYCHLLETLPNNFGQLNRLEELGLSGCKVLLNGPVTLSGLNSIKKLFLNDYEARKFPSWVCTLTSLQVLQLENNDFVSVPDSIRQLSLLNYLSLSWCRHLQSVELPWQTTSSDISDWVSHCFYFDVCESLGEGARRNIVEKTMMRIQSEANRKKEVCIRSLTVSLPGNKIPEFFEGPYTSCATVELPLDFSSSTFRGLVVGFIVFSWYFPVNFKCTLKKTDDSYLCSYTERICIGGMAYSDTLYLHYIPSGVIREYCKDNLKDATHATFDFGQSDSKFNVRVWGFRLVYADHKV